jgi:purine-nucleoside phosphorylase
MAEANNDGMRTWAEIHQKLDEAVKFISGKVSFKPEIGIILGTGLGSLVDGMKLAGSVEYEDIPHFPTSTVESHHGRLLFGTLRGKRVVCMQGRFHYYEGYTLKQVTFPVRVMKFLGVRTLLISNAAGGMNPHYRKGSIMVIADHINLLGDNPLIGPNDDTLGPRFPDMSEPYSRRLITLAEEVALGMKIRTERGVFVAVPGPNLETRAEYRFLRFIGADAVGMSTVPEVIVAVHMGVEVLGFSIITDECFPDALQPANVDEIIAVAMNTEPKLTAIMKGVVEQL